MPASAQLVFALNAFSPIKASDYYATNPGAQGNEYGPSVKQEQVIDGLSQSVGASNSELDRPAETLVLWEHHSTAPICNFLQSSDWFATPPSDDVLRNHFNFLHMGGTNTLWGDSHVKRLVYGQLRRPMFSVRKDIYPSG